MLLSHVSFIRDMRGEKCSMHSDGAQEGLSVSIPGYRYKENCKIMGHPLKGRNILGCSGAISLHQHFRVLSGINRFQINETGFQTGFQSKVLKNPELSCLNRFQILENWF